MNKLIERIGIYRDNGENDKEIIEWIENEIKYCLPKTYKEIIFLYDGLRPKKNIFDFINIYGEKDDRDISFLSYQPQDTKYNKDGYYIPMKDFQISKFDYGIQELVTFGDCANGDYICFDYRDNLKTCNPKVVHVYHDDHTENEDGTSSMTVNFVANSFEEFIDMLYEDDE
jgi:hypothetical protein